MSEKQQHTTAHMRDQMMNRYGDGLHHKHDKDHNAYRQHCRSHPCQMTNGQETNEPLNCSTGRLHASNLRKIRKRLDKGRFH